MPANERPRPPIPHAAPAAAGPHGGGVRPATARDLDYVVKLQKQHGDALGFIPRAALEEKIDRGRVHLALENGEPAGYLHHGSVNAAPEVRVFQAAIQYDARRRHLGLALVDDLARRAAQAGAKAISLRCLSRLEANDFWRAAGFRLLDTEPGAKGTLNVWGRLLDEGESSSALDVHDTRIVVPSQSGSAPFPFHSRMHPCPRCGRWTTDTWARGARRFTLCRTCLSASGERDSTR